MNKIQRVSSFPMRQCITGSNSTRRSLPAPVDTTPSRRMGCAHIAPSTRNVEVFQSAFEIERVVQLNTPIELKATMGIDKLFAETRGPQIITIAATKKLLEEEKLRQSLKNFCVPLEGIICESKRQRSPSCATIKEKA